MRGSRYRDTSNGAIIINHRIMTFESSEVVEFIFRFNEHKCLELLHVAWEQLHYCMVRASNLTDCKIF